MLIQINRLHQWIKFHKVYRNLLKNLFFNIFIGTSAAFAAIYAALPCLIKYFEPATQASRSHRVSEPANLMSG